VSSLLKAKDQDIFSLQAQLSEAQQKAEQELLVQQQNNN
jgi:type IV secretory pathway component VirB8